MYSNIVKCSIQLAYFPVFTLKIIKKRLYLRRYIMVKP